jgi:hypothetical protein
MDVINPRKTLKRWKVNEVSFVKTQIGNNKNDYKKVENAVLECLFHR